MMELSASANQPESCQILFYPLFGSLHKRTIDGIFGSLMASTLLCTRLTFCGMGRFEN
jgi:hypothetical protein